MTTGHGSLPGTRWFPRVRRAHRVPRIGILLCAFLAASLAALDSASAAYLQDVPQALTQPDGKPISCFASGDEYYHWLHDEKGYVIVQHPATGYWVWADKRDGLLVPTDLVVGSASPEVAGLLPGILPDPEHLKDRRRLLSPDLAVAAPSTGTINNLTVFIRFSDEFEFTDLIADYDDLFNASRPGHVSMSSYFSEASYQQLDVSTTFYPTPGLLVVSYQDSEPRDYYRPHHPITNLRGYQTEDERRVREHTLLYNAVAAVASEVPATLDIDADDDGHVDNVCFIVYGSPDGWSDLLWPHKWALWTVDSRIHGIRVYEYNLQLQNSLGVSVLCHEMYHTLGAPDLYHYPTCSAEPALIPVGIWDVMAHSQDPPQHTSAYMKYRYTGWIPTLPELLQSGVYTLLPLTAASGNCYKIPSLYSSTEHYVVEYRQRVDVGPSEFSLPGSGLLVYRINTTEDGNGNDCGPPDEVYLYRPRGTVTENGDLWWANFSEDVGRTVINDFTDPAPFLSDGTPGGLNIANVSTAGSTISFTLIGGQLDTWVDFSYSGPETGSFTNPRNTLAEGVSIAPVGTTVIMKAGTSSETLVINKSMTLRAWDGPVVVGSP